MTLALLLACAGSDDDALPGGDLAEDTFDLADPLPLAADIDEDELAAHIQALQDLGTRFTGTDGEADTQAWLVDALEGLGWEADLAPFSWRGGLSANVIARKDGATDAVWIYSAHYDSTSESPEAAAPGADDNASAVAAGLDIARILGPRSLRDDVWIVFTGAEEQGAKGGAAMVDLVVAEGADVRGVVAPDMIGYWPLGDGDAFDILGDDGSADLAASMAEVADTLGVANKVWIDHTYCYGDDHTKYQEADIPALSPMDCVESHNGVNDEDLPHYHRSTDTIDTLHLGFTARVSGVLVAALGGWAGVLE